MDTDKTLLGERIKDIRLNSPKLAKHSRDELAEVVGSSRSNVSRWERGINIPNPKTLKAIADLGKTTVGELLDGNPLSKFSDEELLDELRSRGHDEI